MKIGIEKNAQTIVCKQAAANIEKYKETIYYSLIQWQQIDSIELNSNCI